MYSQDVRTIAMRLYHKVKSLRKVASIIETSHSTISRWNSSVFQVRKIQNRKIEYPCIIDAMNLYITTHPFASIKDVQKLILDQFKTIASLELVRVAIKRNNFTKKRARYFSIPKNDKEKLDNFLQRRKMFVDENRIFVSIDETSFGRNYLPASGYSKKGTRLMIKRPFISIQTSSVVAAVAVNYPLRYFKKSGSFNTDSYCEFLESLDFPENSVLVMDNVSFHHSIKAKDLIKTRGWDVLFVPPYSPVFNPIEGVFSIVKRHYQKFMNIPEAFTSVTNKHLISFFRGSFNAIQRH